MSLAATLIDFNALGDVALLGTVGALALVGLFCGVVLAADRQAQAGGGVATFGWRLAMGAFGLACVALVVLAIWAMTQK